MIATSAWGSTLTALALTTAAYALAGKLALLLAVPPAQTVAIWPGAGVAVAAMLHFGYRMWPAVIAGSILVGIWTSFDPASATSTFRSIAIAAVIGTIATLQAILGTHLVRRFASFQHGAREEIAVGRLVVLAGPVACILSATFGTAVLALTGTLDAGSYTLGWFTKWVADSIGVLVVAPLILAWTGHMPTSWRRHRAALTLPVAGAATVAVTCFLYVNRLEQHNARDDFDEHAQSLAASITFAVNGYREAVHGLERLFSTYDSVSAVEFATFVAHTLDRHPGIQALQWTPRVLESQRADYESRLRQHSHVASGITELRHGHRVVPATQRREYFPVHYAAPAAPNEKMLGFDQASNPIRRRAIEMARDSGLPIATPPVTVVHGQHETRVVLIFHPVYKAAPTTVEARRRDLRGFALAVVRVGDLIDAALQNFVGSGVNVWLFDETARFGKHILYARAADGALPPQSVADVSDKSPLGFSWTSTIQFGGRRWVLAVSPTYAYVDQHRFWSAWAALAGGLMFTGMLDVFLLVIAGRQAAIHRVVDERTVELNREIDRRKDLVLRLAQSNKNLEQFAYVASHDLQEPLRTVSSYVQLLAVRYRGKLDADADEFIDYAVDGANHLQNLIQDILGFSRVQTRGRRFELVDLNALVAATVASLGDTVRDHEAVVTTGTLPMVHADPAQMAQLFENLLENALKFRRPERAPEIDIGAESCDEDWLFRIADNGIGIRPEFFERIFNVFQRLHSRKEYPGTGIGLAICKRIVLRHGGRIWVRSSPGKGSTFCFTLPKSTDMLIDEVSNPHLQLAGDSQDPALHGDVVSPMSSS